MKIKLKYLNPNPFKKEINKGKLDKETINKIKSNIKELGLMGSLPVFKKDNKYFLIAGHHRVQALKETYGNDFEVEVTLHNYSDEQIIRGMIIENLTQRQGDFREEVENLVLIRNYLKKKTPVQTLDKRDSLGRKNNEQEAGSIRDIYNWLNKNGEVMSIGKIGEWLRVKDNLSEDILNEISFNKGHTHKDKGKISIEDAKNLARIKDLEHQNSDENSLINWGDKRGKKGIKQFDMRKKDMTIALNTRQGQENRMRLMQNVLKQNLNLSIEAQKLLQ